MQQVQGGSPNAVQVPSYEFIAWPERFEASGELRTIILRARCVILVDVLSRHACLQQGVKLQEDSIASIKTKGLIGEKYIRISPGGSDKIIGPNGKIREVEAPVDFEELLSKYIFGKV